ncbi:MAG: hypothetical protein K0S33_1132 [Bacteroidetes bacterium]|jgi:hypothetical protein|nr:hypothetical protein [Bacteroidota bacterium]
MLYNRLTGNGGTFVEFNDYDVPDGITKKIRNENFCNDSTVLLGYEKNGYLHLLFYDQSCKEYFHTFVSTDTTWIKTKIVFYGVSETKDMENTQRINKDFGILSRHYYLQRFKKVVLDKLEKLM